MFEIRGSGWGFNPQITQITQKGSSEKEVGGEQQE
jgi:hypothetical protein